MNGYRLVKAFSLIELMVVVAILALLAAVALPNYRDYRVRAVVASALPLLDKLKIEVLERRENGVVWGQNYVYAIAPTDTDKPEGVHSTATGWYGCVEITYLIPEAGITNTPTTDLIIEVCPVDTNGIITWNTGYHPNSTTAFTLYLPYSFQQPVGNALTWDDTF